MIPRKPTRAKKTGHSEIDIHASAPIATPGEKIKRMKRYVAAKPNIAMKAEVRRSTNAFAPSTPNIPATR